MKPDVIGIKGIIEILVIDAKTKEILKRHNFTNILTNNGIKMHRNWAGSVTPIADVDYNVDTRITHVAVGDGDSTPGKTQTALDNELLREEVYPTPASGNAIVFDDNETVVFEMLIDETQLNGETIKEIGLFSETFTNFMVSRFLAGSLQKTAAVQFKIRYKLKYVV